MLPRGEEHRHDIPVNRLCQIMDVSPRGYRAWRNRPVSASQRKDLVVLAHIRDQFEQSLGSYGRPRMTEELKALGLAVGHRRVGRLMKENGIKVRRNKKFKATTDSNHSFNIAPNLLDRDFSAARPNRKWAGDISYVRTQEGWLYLAVILDLHSRRVGLPPSSGPLKMLVHGRPLVYRDNAFRRWWTVSQRAVRSDSIVVAAPSFDQNLSLPQRVEDLAVQQFVPESCVKALAVTVLPR